MRSAVAEHFVDFTSPLEGVVPWMYLDVLGLVTVAIGNLIDPVGAALGLPFVRPDGTPATRDEIAAAWQAVKSRRELAQQGYRAAARFTSIRLTDEGVKAVVHGKLLEIEAHLRGRFPAWDLWPADAQLATLSMAWACGSAFHFPKLEAALRACDWATAALECKISEAGNPGVKPRNVANRALYLAAAAGGDPEVLDWPTTQPIRVADHVSGPAASTTVPRV